MPSVPSKIDPRWTFAHLKLLSQYFRCREGEKFVGHSAAQWRGALGESCEEAFERLIGAGLIAACSLQERLDSTVPYGKAKQMLRDRGLKASGRKTEMIERLWEADVEAMRRIVAEVHLFRCTESGQQLAKSFLEYCNEMERTAFGALRERNVNLAFRVVCDFEDSLGFPENPSFPSKPDISNVRCVFAVKPKILATVSEEVLEHLRVAAAMAFLGIGGSWLPDGLRTGLAMKNEVAVRMIVFHVQSSREVEQEKQHADLVSEVSVVFASEEPYPPCDACRALKDKRWDLGEQPELPYEHCIHDMGCRCSYEFVYRGE